MFLWGPSCFTLWGRSFLPWLPQAYLSFYERHWLVFRVPWCVRQLRCTSSANGGDSPPGSFWVAGGSLDRTELLLRVSTGRGSHWLWLGFLLGFFCALLVLGWTWFSIWAFPSARLELRKKHLGTFHWWFLVLGLSTFLLPPFSAPCQSFLRLVDWEVHWVFQSPSLRLTPVYFWLFQVRHWVFRFSQSLFGVTFPNVQPSCTNRASSPLSHHGLPYVSTQSIQVHSSTLKCHHSLLPVTHTSDPYPW